MTLWPGYKFAHPDEAEIGEIWMAVRVALRQGRQVRQVVAAVERQRHQTIVHHRQNDASVLQMKRGFRKH